MLNSAGHGGHGEVLIICMMCMFDLCVCAGVFFFCQNIIF